MIVAVSQNGWKANDRSLIASYALPGGGKVAVRKGDVATILVYVAKRFHSEVENLIWPGNWGYAERPIRGGTSLSNHASGTAIDLNAPRHPLGKRGTFSKSQVRKIKAILADCGGVIRWGGNYSGRKDEMHFEINAGSAAVRRVARAIRAGEKPGPSGGATASPGSSGGRQYGDANERHDVGSRVMRKYTSGTDVRWLQKRLYKVGQDVGDFDGDFGPTVEKAVRSFQKAAGIKVDGEVYTETIKALKAAKVVRQLPKGSSAAKPKGKVPGKHYKHPYGKNGYIGPLEEDNDSHSGIGGRKTNGIYDRTHNKRFVNQLEERGWDPEGDYLVKYGNDGKYGDELESLIRAFQADQGLLVDGRGGYKTWTAAFENPVT